MWHVCYALDVTEPDYFWTPTGRSNAIAAGLIEADVIQALHSDTIIDNVVEPDRYVCGPADSGRLVTVHCERILPGVTAWMIKDARPAYASEAALWRKEYPR